MKYKTKREFLLSAVLLVVGFLGGMFCKNLFREGVGANDLLHTSSQVASSQNALHKQSETTLYHTTLAVNEVEYNFTATVRSCLGPECYDSRPAKSVVDRVGILALPGSGVQAILMVLRKVTKSTPLKFEIELDTHVPAYGYGKNHGWNRIVRVVRRLVPHSYSLLKNAYPGSGNGSSIPVGAFETQIRQLTRWHCRLSHVAAHTKMLSVFLEDVYVKPAVELERIITFIGVPLQRADLLAAVAEMQLQTFKKDDEDVPEHLRAAGLRVLREEMLATKGLTDWPCKPFRELEGKGGRLQLHTRDLAANCSDPFVKCTVGFDLKEQI